MHRRTFASKLEQIKRADARAMGAFAGKLEQIKRAALVP